jgi:hypothetical protein
VAHHKRRRPRNRRAGCLMCKYWKVNGFRTERKEGEAFSAYRQRLFARREIAEALHERISPLLRAVLESGRSSSDPLP